MMVWFVQSSEIADASGKGTGRWRMTARSDEGGGGPFGDTSHDHTSADEAETCERCDEFCSRITGFPSRRAKVAQQEKRERAEYERLKAKFDPPPPPLPPIESIEEQIEGLKAKYPNAITKQVRTGLLVMIPDFQLPIGYNKQKCAIYFIAPNGYPFAVPYGFFTDYVFLADGRQPHYARRLEESDRAYWGFDAQLDLTIWGWKVSTWDPRRDRLKTYVSVIKNRLNNVNAGWC